MSKRNNLFQRIKALFPRIPPSAPDGSGTVPEGGSSAAGAARRVKTGFAYRREMLTSLGEAPPPLPANAYSSPLVIAGSRIGAVQAIPEANAWTIREMEIVDGVAAQLARHLEELERSGGNGGPQGESTKDAKQI